MLAEIRFDSHGDIKIRSSENGWLPFLSGILHVCQNLRFREITNLIRATSTEIC